MPRPKKERKVHKPPLFLSFKPTGITSKELEKITLMLDEYEAIRLSDLLGMSQEEAALEMEISRPTFTRLIEKARKKLADFMINGKLLLLEGGNIHFRHNIIMCESCGNRFNINILQTMDSCPNCNSAKLTNLAGGFGHGKCCRD